MKIKKCLILKEFYEKFFIIAIGSAILLWLIDIFLNGMFSNQFDLFFARGKDFLADFLNVVGYSSERDPYNNTMYTGLGEKAYPPLVYVITYLFSRIENMQIYYDKNNFLSMYEDPLLLIVFSFCIFVVFVIGCNLIREYKTGSKASRLAITFVILFSGPIMHTIERGNIIFVVPFLLLYYVFNYNSSNKIRKEFALICLALAAGFKLTPAIFGFLLLANKQWKDAVRAALYGCVAIFLPFLFFKGGFWNIPLMLRNLGLLMESYGNAEGCTVRNMLDVVAGLFGFSYPAILSSVISVLLTLILLVFCICTKSTWEKVLAISVILVCMPNYSGYYCNIYYIPALICFLNSFEHKKVDIMVLVAFVIIFNPLQFGIAFLSHLYLLGNAMLLLFLTSCALYELIGKKKLLFALRGQEVPVLKH